MHKPGFTLIELCITITLLAFMATMCLPALLTYSEQIVSAQAHVLKTICWYEQQLARATHEQKILRLDVVAQRYDDNSGIAYKLPAQVKFGVMPNIFGPPASPRALVTNATTFPENNIKFYPEGAIQAGSVYLTDQKKHVQYALTISVAGASLVRLYHHVGNRWVPCT